MSFVVTPLKLFLGAYAGAAFAHDKKYDIPVSASLGATTACVLPSVSTFKPNSKVGAIALGVGLVACSVFYIGGVYYGTKMTVIAASEAIKKH